MNTTSGTIALC